MVSYWRRALAPASWSPPLSSISRSEAEEPELSSLHSEERRASALSGGTLHLRETEGWTLQMRARVTAQMAGQTRMKKRKVRP